MSRALVFVGFALGLLVSGSGHAQDKIIRLTSLDWPPYAAQKAAENGVSVAIVRAAAEAMGYRLEVKFFPWARAVSLVTQAGSGYAGYFPEYHSESVAKDFLLSAPIGSGPLGFVERKSEPVAWSTLADLKGRTIGVVNGYVNTEQFDRMAAGGELKTEAVVDDLTNLRKVANGRVKLAVIDRNVMNHLLANEASLADARAMVQFNAQVLENKLLYVALQRSAAGEEAARVINAGLKKIDIKAIEARYLSGK